MAELINAKKRQLIPRWHTSRKMEFFQPGLPLEALKETEHEGNISLFRIDEKKQMWNDSSTLTSATDLFMSLSLANMIHDPLFKQVKNYMVSKQGDISDAVNNIISPRLRKLDSSNTYTTNKERIHQILSTLKRFVKDCPHDSLSWNDLAFYYTVIGEKRKAEQCMFIAFSLKPSHPFLARSYARLLVHNDEPEKAIHILNKSGMAKSHPGILSADIAIRATFDIGKPDVKAARRLINKYSRRPDAISELSASIGTLEVENGSLKNAKAHLLTSALVPTENTIAQLKWMSQQHNIYTPLNNITVRSLEADAITSYNNHDYSDCRDKLMTLHRFQPFSESALVDAGYLSIIALDEPGFLYHFTEEFSADTLHSFMGKNNYLIAKLLSNDLNGADQLILDLNRLISEDSEKAILSAAMGMYLYCIGEVDSGRKRYEDTNVYFKAHKNYHSLALSLLHQGLMEKKHDINNAKILLEKAKNEAKKAIKSPELLDKVIRELKLIDTNYQEL